MSEAKPDIKALEQQAKKRLKMLKIFIGVSAGTALTSVFLFLLLLFDDPRIGNAFFNNTTNNGPSMADFNQETMNPEPVSEKFEEKEQKPPLVIFQGVLDQKLDKSTISTAPCEMIELDEFEDEEAPLVPVKVCRPGRQDD